MFKFATAFAIVLGAQAAELEQFSPPTSYGFPNQNGFSHQNGYSPSVPHISSYQQYEQPQYNFGGYQYQAAPSVQSKIQEPRAHQVQKVLRQIASEPEQVQSQQVKPQQVKTEDLNYSQTSTHRPRDIKAFNSAPVDPYYLESAKPAEDTIKAECKFDFLGYSGSSGSITLIQEKDDNTSIIGNEFKGLQPGPHALRIHTYGNLEHGCEGLGPVFNPFDSERGHSHEDIILRRVGDLENVFARFDTTGETKNRDSLVQLSGPNSVIGRSMAIYEREDDHDQTEHKQTEGSEPRYREGEGRRIACCVIGLKK